MNNVGSSPLLAVRQFSNQLLVVVVVENLQLRRDPEPVFHEFARIMLPEFLWYELQRSFFQYY